MQKNSPEYPLELFRKWYQEAKQYNVKNFDADAAALATATLQGKPSVRIILLKAFDERGFVFYTNLTSRKSRELLENPQASLCFYWVYLAKQVRIEGKVEQVSKEEADNYFASRLRESKIAAWASSKQSSPIGSLEELHQVFEKYTEEFQGVDVPRPTFWSGFRLIPEAIEFWKLGEYRLHERIYYSKNQEGRWGWVYLYP